MERMDVDTNDGESDAEGWTEDSEPSEPRHAPSPVSGQSPSQSISQQNLRQWLHSLDVSESQAPLKLLTANRRSFNTSEMQISSNRRHTLSCFNFRDIRADSPSPPLLDQPTQYQNSGDAPIFINFTKSLPPSPINHPSSPLSMRRRRCSTSATSAASPINRLISDSKSFVDAECDGERDMHFKRRLSISCDDLAFPDPQSTQEKADSRPDSPRTCNPIAVDSTESVVSPIAFYTTHSHSPNSPLIRSPRSGRQSPFPRTYSIPSTTRCPSPVQFRPSVLGKRKLDDEFESPNMKRYSTVSVTPSLSCASSASFSGSMESCPNQIINGQDEDECDTSLVRRTSRS